MQKQIFIFQLQWNLSSDVKNRSLMCRVPRCSGNKCTQWHIPISPLLTVSRALHWPFHMWPWCTRMHPWGCPHQSHTSACGRDYFIPPGPRIISDFFLCPFQIHRHILAITYLICIINSWNGGISGFFHFNLLSRPWNASFLYILRMKTYVRGSSMKTGSDWNLAAMI